MSTNVPKPTAKQKRAFAYLMLKDKFNLREMAEFLNEPLSTIQKPDNAFKRLTGALGPTLKAEALESLSKVDAGFKQIHAIGPHTDHKMVSDLVAMRYAVLQMVNVLLEQAGDNIAKSDLTAKVTAQVKTEFHVAIDALTEAVDNLVNVLPEGDDPLTEAVEELLTAVINLEYLK